MNRREFLQAFGSFLVLAECSVPLPELGHRPARPDFDRRSEYGNALTMAKDVTEFVREEMLHEARVFLVHNALKILPRNTPFEVRLGLPTDYGRLQQMAWYYSPGFWAKIHNWPGSKEGAIEVAEKAPLSDGGVFVPSLGVYQFGRFWS